MYELVNEQKKFCVCVGLKAAGYQARLRHKIGQHFQIDLAQLHLPNIREETIFTRCLS